MTLGHDHGPGNPTGGIPATGKRRTASRPLAAFALIASLYALPTAGMAADSGRTAAATVPPEAAQAAALPAPLPQEAIRYRIELLGIQIGRIGLNAVVRDGHYALAGRMESVGVAAAVHAFRFEARTEGRITAGRTQPVRYQEAARAPRRDTRTEVVWSAGAAHRLLGEPADAFAGMIDPATQGDTLDILTALYLLLRAQPAAEVCALETPLYDGRRRSQLDVVQRIVEDDAIQCRGRFRRLEGFDPGELRAHASFPFDAEYRRGPDGLMRAETIRIASVLGQAQLRRLEPSCAQDTSC